MCYKLKEKSNYLTMGTDSGQMRQHAADDCMGSDENGLEFTDRGKDRCR